MAQDGQIGFAGRLNQDEAYRRPPIKLERDPARLLHHPDPLILGFSRHDLELQISGPFRREPGIAIIIHHDPDPEIRVAQPDAGKGTSQHAFGHAAPDAGHHRHDGVGRVPKEAFDRRYPSFIPGDGGGLLHDSLSFPVRFRFPSAPTLFPCR